MVNSLYIEIGIGYAYIVKEHFFFFFLGLSQYGELHLGQKRGFFSFLGNHVCLHLLHFNFGIFIFQLPSKILLYLIQIYKQKLQFHLLL